MPKDFIFNPNTSSDNEEMLFVLKGYEQFLDDEGNPRTEDVNSPHIAAKCVKNKKSKHFQQNSYYYTFYIRSTPNDTLYNPVTIYSPIENKRQFDFIDKVCKDKWSFKEVSHSTFKKYVEFLKTKSLSWLKDAERDLK